MKGAFVIKTARCHIPCFVFLVAICSSCHGGNSATHQSRPAVDAQPNPQKADATPEASKLPILPIHPAPTADVSALQWNIKDVEAVLQDSISVGYPKNLAMLLGRGGSYEVSWEPVTAATARREKAPLGSSILVVSATISSSGDTVNQLDDPSIEITPGEGMRPTFLGIGTGPTYAKALFTLPKNITTERGGISLEPKSGKRKHTVFGVLKEAGKSSILIGPEPFRLFMAFTVPSTVSGTFTLHFANTTAAGRIPPPGP